MPLPLTMHLTLTGIPMSTTMGMSQVVQKRLDHVRYRRQVPPKDIPIEFVGWPKVNAATSLNFVDLSDSIAANSSLVYVGEITIVTGVTLSVNNLDVLISDKFRTLETGEVEPFFYNHVIDMDPLDAQHASIQKVNSSGELEEVDPELYSFEAVQIDVRNVGFVYTNLRNSFDEITGEYELYWVQWIDQNGGSHSELLDSTVVFHVATFDDIDSTLGTLDPESNSYTSTYTGTGYVLGMSRTSTYYIKYLNDNSIYPIEPTLTTIDDPWFVSVYNGAFVSGPNSYSVPEFALQSFDPVYPILMAIDETARKVSPSIIKLQRENTAVMYVGAAFPLHLTLILRDKSTGDVEYALSTDTALGGTQYLSAIHPITGAPVMWDTETIQDWDNAQGMVTLNQNIVYDRYDIDATYQYFAQAYEYTKVNLNPYLNPSILDTMLVLYLVPNVGPSGTSVHHLLVQNGLITAVSDPALDAFIGGAPNPGSVIGTPYTNSIYPPSFTVMFPDLLILAEVNPICVTQPQTDYAIDIRQLGGGIRPEWEDDAIMANYRIAYTPGVAPVGGYEYPTHGSIVIKVPYTLHTNHGGELEDIGIRALVEKNIAGGEYAIIKLDGVIPEFGCSTDDQGVFSVGGGTALLQWHQEDPVYTFNIYRGVAVTGLGPGWSISPDHGVDFELIANVAAGSELSKHRPLF